jgi:hypothetical protein
MKFELMRLIKFAPSQFRDIYFNPKQYFNGSAPVNVTGYCAVRVPLSLGMSLVKGYLSLSSTVTSQE